MKEASPCADCGVWYPFFVMHFDHVRGKKVGNINRLVAGGARQKLLDEIAKCEVVCANCHSRRTWERLGIES